MDNPFGWVDSPMKTAIRRHIKKAPRSTSPKRSPLAQQNVPADHAITFRHKRLLFRCMSPLNAHHPVVVAQAFAQPSSSREDRILALIERRSALVMFAVATVLLMLLWVAQSAQGVIEPHDRWAAPALAGLMALLCLALLRRPHSLVWAQRIGVICIASYLAVSAVSMLTSRNPVSPLWLSTLFQCLPLLYLLLLATWTSVWALVLATVAFCAVGSPALLLALTQPEMSWRGSAWPLFISGVIAQSVFLIALANLVRVRRSVAAAASRASEFMPTSPFELDRIVNRRTAELTQAKAAAEAASLAKGRFLAVMSHELRTPLHAVLAAAELLRDGRRECAGPRDELLIDTIRRSGTHLLTLIDQVLDLSRIEAGKLELAEQPLDLRDVAARALQAVAQQAQNKGLTLQSDLAEQMHKHRSGDALRLSQVLINLLANAVKFTQHGSVSLTIEPEPGSSNVRFVVRDTGPGLSEEQQRNVFEAFHQVERPAGEQLGGAGLGLTITKELVSLMNGRIHLHSLLGVGTQVEIVLPMPEVPEPSRHGQRCDEQSPCLRGVYVLVVEDDPVNTMLAQEMLSSAGAMVSTVETGAQALAHLREHGSDVVLMDWHMPEMDGLETTQRIRAGDAGQAAQDVPVIGLTASAFTDDRNACLAAGMNHVLTKPIEKLKLLQDVRLWADARAAMH